jgi:predicted nucleotidyltransferase
MGLSKQSMEVSGIEARSAGRETSISDVSDCQRDGYIQGMAIAETNSPNVSEGLTAAASRALALFRDAARTSLGDRLTKIVLFGSRARGDARSDSDLDVAVVLYDVRDRRADRNRLADLAYDAIVETSMDIQAVPVSLDEWDHPDHHSNPALIRAIKRDGRVIETEHDSRTAEQSFTIR